MSLFLCLGWYLSDLENHSSALFLYENNIKRKDRDV